MSWPWLHGYETLKQCDKPTKKTNDIPSSENSMESRCVIGVFLNKSSVMKRHSLWFRGFEHTPLWHQSQGTTTQSRLWKSLFMSKFFSGWPHDNRRRAILTEEFYLCLQDKEAILMVMVTRQGATTAQMIHGKVSLILVILPLFKSHRCPKGGMTGWQEETMWPLHHTFLDTGWFLTRM